MQTIPVSRTHTHKQQTTNIRHQTHTHSSCRHGCYPCTQRLNAFVFIIDYKTSMHFLIDPIATQRLVAQMDYLQIVLRNEYSKRSHVRIDGCWFNFRTTLLTELPNGNRLFYSMNILLHSQKPQFLSTNGVNFVAQRFIQRWNRLSYAFTSTQRAGDKEREREREQRKLMVGLSREGSNKRVAQGAPSARLINQKAPNIRYTARGPWNTKLA